MQIGRRSIIYSSLIIVMALFLSAGLLHLTRENVQSAPLAQIPSVDITIEKWLDGEAPATPWEFMIEGEAYSNTVQVAADSAATITVPSGTYTITEVAKDGYYLSIRQCFPDEIPIAALEPMEPPNGLLPMVDYSITITTGLNDWDCWFLNVEKPSLTIVKDAIPDSSQSFHYHVIPEELNNGSGGALEDKVQFDLVDDGTGISNTMTISNLEAYKAYMITESFVDGWLRESAVCEGDIAIPNGVRETSAASLAPNYVLDEPLWITPGADITCTVTNIAPQITVTKTVGTAPGVCATTDEIDVFAGTEVHYCYEVANTGGMTLTTHFLTDDVQGTLLNDFAFPLLPGASVDTIAAGLTVTDTPSASVTNVATWTGVYTQEIIQGELVMTYTAEATNTARVNVFEPSQIVIDKVTDPPGAELDFTFSWGELGETAETVFLSDADAPFESPDLFPGSYSVTETVPADWTLISVDCRDATGATYDPAAIELGEDVVVTCTFTNREDTPTGLDDEPLPPLRRFLPFMDSGR